MALGGGHSMQLIDGRLIHTATDLASFLGCGYRVVLTREAAIGHLERPKRQDPVLERLAKRGLALEADWIAKVRSSGREVVIVPRTERGAGLAAIEEAARHTLDLMHAGTEVIIQGVLFDGTWLGYADVLERVPGNSTLGKHTYEVADTKLRGYVYAGAVIQLAQYTAQLGALIGTEPTSMHVDLGDGRRVTVPAAHAAAFHRRLRERYLQVIKDAVGLDGPLDPASPPPLVPVAAARGRDGTPYPWVVPACRTCPWADACVARRVTDDHLAAVPGMRRDHARRLHNGAVDTRRALAALAPRDLATLSEQIAVPEPILARHREAAALSVDLADNGRDRAIVVNTPPTEPPRGIWRVPPPDPFDMFFHADIDPYRAGRRFTYTSAVKSISGADSGPVTMQAFDDDQERNLVQATVRALLPVIERRRRLGSDTPGPHVYVWGDSPLTALRSAASRHGTGERDFQRLVDGRAIVDLRAITREAIRTARPVDDLPDLDRYIGITGLSEEAPLVAFDRLIEGDPNGARDLEAAMCAAVERLARLRDWLLSERRAIGQATGVRGGTSGRHAEEDNDVGDAIVSMLDLEKARRRAGGEDGERDARAARLLADLLRWHRREDTVQWLDYHGAMQADPADLIDHPSALGGLRWLGEALDNARRYGFPRGQEHRVSVGEEVACHAWGESPKLIVDALDTQAGTIDLRVEEGGSWFGRPPVEAVVPLVPAASEPLRRALIRLSRAIDTLGAKSLGTSGSYRAARRLLRGETPVPPGTTEGDSLVRAHEDAVDALRRLAAALDETALPVQGPPGTGKTHAGAQAILDLIAAGKRVGICANSHRAIGNLLDATMDAATQRGMTVEAVQRAKEAQRCRTESVRIASSNRQVRYALQSRRCQLVAGTAWLFAAQDMDQQLDALFIDEAGQMSLANALAAATSARQLFLLGDPRQLAQPTRGDHPDGVGVSALAHLIGDYDTVPAHRGIFLPVSWRMHPDICHFISEQVYESRLASHPACVNQVIGPREPHGEPIGSGLRRLDVRHNGNRVESREEVLAIARACSDLLGVPWTDHTGETRPLEPRDVIVVAPYNRQVDLLNQMLPPGVVAGTVDRFQGQEAAVVFYSMTASDALDLSRGTEFLFGLDRLNVAISRARALAVLVYSPSLLIAPCRTAEEVRLVNAVCRLAELATPLT
jgi:predicted RecB family nuclease